MEKLEQTIDIVKQILHDENLVLKRLYNDFVGDREKCGELLFEKNFI